MFKFSQIKQVHLEITNNCQASCPMCSRNISGGLPNDLIKVHNWSLEDFKTIMNPTLLSQLHGYYFCGTFGDPMLNDNLIEMCRYSTEVAPNVQIAIHTNGSARSTKWWTELAQALPNDHFVVFALDGLADTQALYRVGTDFNKIIKNAKAFIDAGGKAEWCFIKFKHNEHQVEEARQMAKELGFAEFRDAVNAAVEESLGGTSSSSSSIRSSIPSLRSFFEDEGNENFETPLPVVEDHCGWYEYLSLN
jgi:MoaA/NifB/PqqE/SkfB family radical SAM enzyme